MFVHKYSLDAAVVDQLRYVCLLLPLPGGTPAFLPSSLSPQASLPTSRALATPPKLHTCEKCSTSIA